jgi:hypothetical protein
VSVVAVRGAGTGTVYNLTVDEVHEYFANGVLVSNCDAIRYVGGWLWNAGAAADPLGRTDNVIANYRGKAC